MSSRPRLILILDTTSGDLLGLSTFARVGPRSIDYLVLGHHVLLAAQEPIKTSRAH